MTKDQWLWRVSIVFSRIAAFFSSQTHLFSARYALLHELVDRSIHKAAITKKMPAIFLARGEFDQILAVRPRETQQELAHILLEGKTRIGKGLNIVFNSLTWPFPYIANDIKKELWWATAGFREKGLGGKSLMFDPRGNGCKFDPIEGMTSEFDLKSAATTLLFRPNEGENQIFTDTAITMLTQIFMAATLEGERALPFTYQMMNQGFFGAATILEIISEKHHYYPNLATTFLDISYDKADFESRFLRDCWSTVTSRMRRILTKESVRCFTGSDFTAKDVITSGKHPLSVYLCWPEQHLTSLAPLIQLVWNSLYNGMTGYFDDVRGKGCYRVMTVLDEIFRTGLPELKHYVTTAAGRNISIMLSAQSDSQFYAAYGQYEAEVLKEQFDHIVKYRPAPAANRTAHNYEESLGYTSGFAHSKTDHEHGKSEGENEQRIPLLPAHETKLLKPKQVIVQIDGERSTIAHRLDWRDFPELERRANMEPPKMPVVPPLDGAELHPALAKPTLKPLTSWHFDPNLFRRWRAHPAANGGGEKHP
jgi:type IV secretory pathway TraG/TraD family ATPase VirD4